MEVVRSAAELRRTLARVRASGEEIGLVPTMGALHGGHRALVGRAAADGRHVLLTIFVNPLQFDRSEDFARYPRSLDDDLAAAAGMGVRTVFAPDDAEMFPVRPLTTVSVRGLAERFEGASRPGHFDGVATVVAKLFSLAGECTAYFGEKDFQQLAVVRRLVLDLSMPVEVVGCETVREPDGLACSSRNALLDPPARRAATVLWRALGAGCGALDAGERRREEVASAMAGVVATEPLAELDYAAVADPCTLEEPATLDDGAEVRLLLAAWVGSVRLIDNRAAAVGNNRM